MAEKALFSLVVVPPSAKEDEDEEGRLARHRRPEPAPWRCSELSAS